MLSRQVPLATLQFVPPAATPRVPNVMAKLTPPPDSMACPGVPAVAGKLKLYALDAAVFCTVIVAPLPPPFASPSWPPATAFCPIVRSGDTHVKFGLPASEEALLN